MRRNSLWFLVALSSFALAPGCSLLTSFDGFHRADAGNAQDGNGIDAAGMDSGPRDGGGSDAGPEDGGVMCDPACGPTGTCMDGVCRCGSMPGPCSEGQTCCAGQCVNTLNDVEYCGNCSTVCPSGERATRTCVDGACGFECDTGFADCPGSTVRGCETDLGNPVTCGSCTTMCSVGQLCSQTAGVYECTNACDPGESNCSGSCVDTDTSVSHCGGCNQPCVPRADATAACNNGSCSYTCNAPAQNCNGTFNDGCEVIPPFQYPDADGDGYGDNASGATRICSGTPGFATNADDCDDTDPDINPDAADGSPVCDAIDNDCDGNTDPGCVCANGQTRACGTSNIGLCRLGTETCSAGVWGSCIGAVEPVGEICDAMDQDCDTDIDEGVTSGSCFCETGSAPGTNTCTSGAFHCEYPDEVCNALDDDCDGVPDGTFACVRGDTENCTYISGGCMAPSTRTCSTSCTLPACPAPPEMCNNADDDCDGQIDDGFTCRQGMTMNCSYTGGVAGCSSPSFQVCTGMCNWGACLQPAEQCDTTQIRDDNCDGFVDEILSIGATKMVGSYSTTGGSQVPLDPTITWVDTMGRAAVAWVSQRSATSYELRFALIDELGSSVFSDRILITLTTRPRNILTGWDGSAWAIFYAPTSAAPLRVIRVAIDGTIATPDQVVPRPMFGTPAPAIRVATLAQGENQLAIMTDRTAANDLPTFIYENGATFSEFMFISGFSGPPARPAVTYIGGGRYMGFAGPPLASLFVQRFSPGGTEGGSFPFETDANVETPLDATWDRIHDSIAFVYDDRDTSGNARVFQLLVPGSAGGPLTSPVDLGGASIPPRAFVGAGGDGSFATALPTTTTPARTRSNDGVRFPVLLPGYGDIASDFTGLAPSAGRFIVLWSTPGNGALNVQVYGC